MDCVLLIVSGITTATDLCEPLSKSHMKTKLMYTLSYKAFSCSTYFYHNLTQNLVMSNKLLKKFLSQQGSLVSNPEAKADKSNKPKRNKNIQDIQENRTPEEQLKDKLRSMLALDQQIQSCNASESSLLNQKLVEQKRIEYLRKKIQKKEDGAGFGNSRAPTSRMIKNKPRPGPTVTKRRTAELRKRKEERDLKHLAQKVQEDAIETEKKKRKMA